MLQAGMSQHGLHRALKQQRSHLIVACYYTSYGEGDLTYIRQTALQKR